MKHPEPPKKGRANRDPGIIRLLAAKLRGQRTEVIVDGSPRGPKGRVLNPITDMPKGQTPGKRKPLQRFGKDFPDERPKVS